MLAAPTPSSWVCYNNTYNAPGDGGTHPRDIFDAMGPSLCSRSRAFWPTGLDHLGALRRGKVHHSTIHRLRRQHRAQPWSSCALRRVDVGHPTLSILTCGKRTGAPRHDIASNQTVPCPRTVMMSSSRSAFWPPTVDHPGCTTSTQCTTEREIVGGSILPPSTLSSRPSLVDKLVGGEGHPLIICPMGGSPNG